MKLGTVWKFHGLQFGASVRETVNLDLQKQMTYRSLELPCGAVDKAAAESKGGEEKEVKQV